ncbi:MAG TPA: AAA family ATPase [Pirellulales bacterium]|nr:AAA family ATPase [Pirellulales bacterium]
MYEAYWKLSRRPFGSGADPRAYYPSDAHQGALLKLRYTIENQHSAALLTGPPGSGKTLLLRLLSDQLPDRFQPIVELVFPEMPAAELLASLAAGLGTMPPIAAGTALPTIADSIARIQAKLREHAAKGRHTVLAIDDAQLLEGNRTFETLRLLLNMEADGRPLLTLLLVGQPALLPMMERMPHFEERLGAKCLLRPLTVEETMSYVSHRLTTAGAQQTIFDTAALETLFRLTRGVPRRINRLCDLALLIAFADEQPTVGSAHIEAVAQELAVAAVE